MSNFNVLPVEVVTPPNYYTLLPANRWSVTGVNAITLWGIIQIHDGLGIRRYIPATGATLQAVFLRKDNVALTANYPLSLVNTNQNITSNAVLNGSDRSLFSLVITAADATKMVSGSVKFTLTEGGITQTWVQDWLVQKTVPQVGC